MATKNVPENPFYVVSAGGQCIDKPRESWSYDNSTTFVFTIPYNVDKPFKYLNISLRPQHTLGEGWAAAIYGRAFKGVVMGDEYYMGDLGTSKMSSFYEISPTKRGTTCITIYISIQPKSEVDRIIKDYRQGRLNTGPFKQLT